MMLTRRTFALTSLGLAAAATLAACSSKSKDEATEEGKMALIVPDAGEAAAEALSKAVEAFTKETKVEVDIKPVSDVSQELARGITAEPSIDVVVLNPAQLSSYAGALHSWDKGAAAVKDANPALLTSATRQDKIAAAAVTGRPVVALCGKVWTPGRDPSKYPVCPTCKSIYEEMRNGEGSGDGRSNGN